MSKGFFDYEDGDFVYTVSGNTAFNSNGDMLMRMSESTVLNVNTGDIHIISGWHNNDDNDD